MKAPAPRVDDIQKVTAAYFKITRARLLARNRERIYTEPRQVAMYLARVLTWKSLPQIGQMFGGRDHSTVFHAVDRIAAKIINGDATIQAAVTAIRQTLTGEAA